MSKKRSEEYKVTQKPPMDVVGQAIQVGQAVLQQAQVQVQQAKAQVIGNTKGGNTKVAPKK